MRTTTSASPTGLLLRFLIAGVCAPFLVGAVVRIEDLAAVSREVAGAGITNQVAVPILVVAVQLGGSLLAIFHHGAPASLGALTLAGFTLCATCVSHAFWTYQGDKFIAEMNVFLPQVSIAFALLMVAWGHARSLIAAKRIGYREDSNTHGSSVVEY